MPANTTDTNPRRFAAAVSMRFELDLPASAVDADEEPYAALRQRLFEALLPLTLSTDINFESSSVDDVLEIEVGHAG